VADDARSHLPPDVLGELRAVRLWPLRVQVGGDAPSAVRRLVAVFRGVGRITGSARYKRRIGCTFAHAMSNLRSHHRHLHRLKNVLSVLGALYAFRIFVWRNYFRVALQISSWYRFSAMIGIVLVAFQTVARTYRAFIGHDGLYARLDNLMFGVSYHTQADVFIHRLQGGWSALWVVNLLLEIAGGTDDGCGCLRIPNHRRRRRRQ
jgi:hypothetical protein